MLNRPTVLALALATSANGTAREGAARMDAARPSLLYIGFVVIIVVRQCSPIFIVRAVLCAVLGTAVCH